MGNTLRGERTEKKKKQKEGGCGGGVGWGGPSALRKKKSGCCILGETNQQEKKGSKETKQLNPKFKPPKGLPKRGGRQDLERMWVDPREGGENLRTQGEKEGGSCGGWQERSLKGLLFPLNTV